jgi:hypothetical protein
MMLTAQISPALEYSLPNPHSDPSNVQHPQPNKLTTHQPDHTTLRIFPQGQVDPSKLSAFGVGGKGEDYSEEDT